MKNNPFKYYHDQNILNTIKTINISNFDSLFDHQKNMFLSVTENKRDF